VPSLPDSMDCSNFTRVKTPQDSGAVSGTVPPGAARFRNGKTHAIHSNLCGIPLGGEDNILIFLCGPRILDPVWQAATHPTVYGSALRSMS